MELFSEIEKSFSKIEKLFSTEELLEFKNTSRDYLWLYHFGIGTWIRNYLLTEKSKLYQLFIDNKITHKDDMSTLIIEKFHEHISNSP